MSRTSYAVAIGSNRRHRRHGSPAGVVNAAIQALARNGLEVVARSAIRATPAMGGAGRHFANAAVIVQCEMEPAELLGLLKQLEQDFGRRPGKHWGPRVLDLDILLCSPEGGSPAKGRRTLGSRLRGNTSLFLPHPGLATRDFVLQPLEEIAPGWRHSRSGLTVRQLRSRLRRAISVAQNVRLP